MGPIAAKADADAAADIHTHVETRHEMKHVAQVSDAQALDLGLREDREHTGRFTKAGGLCRRDGGRRVEQGLDRQLIDVAHVDVVLREGGT